jgi:hypothetical protein
MLAIESAEYVEFENRAAILLMATKRLMQAYAKLQDSPHYQLLASDFRIALWLKIKNVLESHVELHESLESVFPQAKEELSRKLGRKSQ